jgi:hypothetical protein
MTGQEKFLERWSRKKREASAVSEAPKNTSDVAAPEERGKTDSPASLPAAPTQGFDLSSLPSIETITAETDIRCFFAPGVPPELTRAALRRAWSADPAIRDYIGLSENAWDFNAPDGHPGFGELLPDVDIKKLVAQLFGEPSVREDKTAAASRAAATPPEPQVATIAEESAPPMQSVALAQSANTEGASLPDRESAAPEALARRMQDQFVQCNSNDASHNDNAKAQSAKSVARRQHGGALPK